MITRELRTSLWIAWAIVSALMFAALVSSFFLSAEQVLSLTPGCVWKAKYGRECAVCGMTRGFIHISRGHFQDAFQSNRASLPLYGLFVVNDLAACYCLGRLVFAHRQWGQKT